MTPNLDKWGNSSTISVVCLFSWFGIEPLGA